MPVSSVQASQTAQQVAATLIREVASEFFLLKRVYTAPSQTTQAASGGMGQWL